MAVGTYLKIVSLNLKAFSFALRNKWLSSREFEASYDKLAPHYDDNWQKFLRPVTDKLLYGLPPIPNGKIVDLGCGTGYSTQFLTKHFPGASVAAVDVSSRMLGIAQTKGAGEAEFIHADMLDYLRSQKPTNASLILSAWAIGYSNPDKIITEAARCLVQNGIFAFVVNYYDTLSPVFRAYWDTLLRHPSKLQMAAWPRFPKKWAPIEKSLLASDFKVLHHEDGLQTVHEPQANGPVSLDWLLKTGIVAGFDQLIPLAEDAELRAEFQSRLATIEQPLQHHYMLAIARKVA